jgi:lipoate-protein ligase B
MDRIYYSDLGLIPYEEAWRLQMQLVDARQQGHLDRDIVLFLEHPAVFTMGRRGDRKHLTVPMDLLEKAGIAIHHIERGGDITYHGPGQLVVYPILRLTGSKLGVVDFVGRLEEIMIQTVTHWGIEASQNPLNRGIWIGNDKLGSIGIAVRRGVTFHGLALNVNPDLSHFGWIHPCGLTGVQMTSMAAQLTSPPNVPEVIKVMRRRWEEIFSVQFEGIERKSLVPYFNSTQTPA